MGESSSLTVTWLAALLAGLLLALFVLTLFFTARTTLRSPLALLRGPSRNAVNGQTTADGLGANTQSTQRAADDVMLPVYSPETVGAPTIRSLLRFSFRYVRRSPVKTGLVLLLAASFTIGLMILRMSVLNNTFQVDDLYHTIRVEAILAPRDPSVSVKAGNGLLLKRGADRLMETGVAESCYLEAEVKCEDIRAVDAETGKAVPGEGTKPSYTIGVLAFNDAERFFTSELGASITVNWLDGWDQDRFMTSENGVYPVVIPLRQYQELNVAASGRIALDHKRGEDVRTATFLVAGTYDSFIGSVSVLASTDTVWRNMLGRSMAYSVVRFDIAPEWNRDMAGARSAVEQVFEESGTVAQPLSILLLDEELNNAVRPLEQLIAVMEALYPIIVILSAAMAAGTAILVTMTFAKDTAIFRALGSGKARTRTMLCLQIVPTCAVGLAVGLATAWVLIQTLPPELSLMEPAFGLAGLYLLSALTGTLSAAVTMTRNNPLELLQVKE